MLELDINYSKDKSIRQLMTTKQIKKTHISISFYMKPNVKSELKHIEVLQDFTDWNGIPISKSITWDIITGLKKYENLN